MKRPHPRRQGLDWPWGLRHSDDAGSELSARMAFPPGIRTLVEHLVFEALQGVMARPCRRTMVLRRLVEVEKHVERVVYERERDIVRRIFDLCAEGTGYSRIAWFGATTSRNTCWRVSSDARVAVARSSTASSNSCCRRTSRTMSMIYVVG
jgi:hypothetical protein